jgi:hypothetical protein
MHPDFTKYKDNEALHEAGFDSYQTARIMILLSAKLHESARLGALHSKNHNNKGKRPSPIKLSENKSIEMPSFSDRFWTEYGNRLRIFGTTESFMELNPDRPKTLPIRVAHGI